MDDTPTSAEKIGKVGTSRSHAGELQVSYHILSQEVVRTQWLDFSTLGSRPLLGRKILIVVSFCPVDLHLEDAY